MRATSHLASFSRRISEPRELGGGLFFVLNILITDKSGAIINQFAKALAECWADFFKFLGPVRESDLVPSQ